MATLIGVCGVVVALLTLGLTGQWERLNWLRGLWRRSPEIVIGVVLHRRQVLLVHRTPRRGSRLFWQFPSGTVRPGDDLEAKLKREILSETGIDVEVRQEIGRRIHPKSGKRCVYFQCDYRLGEPLNADPAENIDVRWVDASDADAYMAGALFGKVRSIIGRA